MQRVRSSSQETNQLALDKSVTTGQGSAILDSIIVDPSDQVLIETMNGHKAAFEVMMSNSTLQLDEMLGLGFMYQQLKSGVEFMKQQKEAGKYVIELADSTVNQAFEFSTGVSDGNKSITEQALELVADVKTDSTQKTLLTVATLLTVFGLGAIYLTQKD